MVVLEGRSNEDDNLPIKSNRSMYDVQENSVRMKAALLLGIGSVERVLVVGIMMLCS